MPGFDHRGCGGSDGEPGRLVPQEQVEDVRAVVACDVIGDGRRSTRSMHDEASWTRLLGEAAGFGNDVTVKAAESLLRSSPEAVVARIAPRPLLPIHGADDALRSPDESRAPYARAGDRRRLAPLGGRGHTEWMFDDHPTFGGVRAEIVDFLASAPRRSVAPAR